MADFSSMEKGTNLHGKKKYAQPTLILGILRLEAYEIQSPHASKARS